MKWSEDEVKILRENYRTRGVGHIMRLLPNRSRDSIQCKAHLLGVSKRATYDYVPWTEKQMRILRGNYPTHPKEELMKLLPGRSWEKIRCKASKLHLKKTAPSWAWGLKEPTGMTDVEKAYLAGIIDGEGWMSFRKSRGALQPELAIANTNVDLIGHLKNIFERCEIQYYCVLQYKNSGLGRKPLYLFRIGSLKEMYRIADELEPYFTIKKQKAKEIKKFIEDKIKRYESGMHVRYRGGR